MIKAIIIGGNSTEEFFNNVNGKNDISVVKRFKLAGDFFDYLSGSSETLVDFDKVVLTSMGLRDAADDGLQQLNDVQEALLFLHTIQPDLYVVLRDNTLYDRYATGELALKYPRTNLSMTKRIFYKDVIMLLLGHYDNAGNYSDGTAARQNFLTLGFPQLDAPDNFSPAPEPVEEAPAVGEQVAPVAPIPPELPVQPAPVLAPSPEPAPEDVGLGLGIMNRLRSKMRRPAPTAAEPQLPPGLEDLTPEPAPLPQKKRRQPLDEESAWGPQAHSMFLFTGDRQAGTTTSAVNTASYLAGFGSTLLLDLDYLRKGVQQFFPADIFQITDDRQYYSLHACLNNPRLVRELAFPVTKSLSVLTSEEPAHEILHGLVESRPPRVKQIGGKTRAELLSVRPLSSLLAFCKTQYDYVVLDCPLILLLTAGESFLHATHLIYCTENTEQALRNAFLTDLLTLGLQEEMLFTNLLSKFFVLLTNYDPLARINKSEATPARVEQLLHSFGTEWEHLRVLGAIPHDAKYLLQTTGKHHIFGELGTAYMSAFQQFSTVRS